MFQYKRIAVKIGSNVLTRKDGTLDITRMSALVDQIAELHKAGMEIVLISSGAVASGRSELKQHRKLDAVSARQLFSAGGQAKLIFRTFPRAWNCLRPSVDDEREFCDPTTLSQSKTLYGSHDRKRSYSYRERK